MIRSNRSEHRLALVMLLLANALWGLSFPVIKAILLLNLRLVPNGGGAFTVVQTLGPRFLIATAILFFFQIGSGRRITRREWKQGLFIGLICAAGMLLQNDALRFTSASTSAFLTQFYAILIPVWLALKIRRNPGAVVWLSCALVLAGAAIIGRFDWHAFRFGRGEGETLLCSVFFMVQILSLEHPAFAGNRAANVTLVWFAVEAVSFGAMTAITAPGLSSLLVQWSNPAWLGLTLLLAAFCTLGAFPLMLIWQPKITATEAGLMYCTEPIFGSIFALILPAVFAGWSQIAYRNETATATLLVGGGLITLANLLVQLKSRAARAMQEAAEAAARRSP